MDFFLELHNKNPREGPGDNESTAKAFNSIREFLPSQPEILDVGCGPGMQTIELARLCGGNITALDKYRQYLDILENNAEKARLAHRIKTVTASMTDMPFEENTFDLIWSEGSIYIMGFENGLTEWRKFLKPGGCMVASEFSWFQKDPPEEVSGFWNEAYPAAMTVEENMMLIGKLKYDLITHFHLPKSAWWNYYNPIKKRIEILMEKYKGEADKIDILNSELKEMELFDKYNDWYGYEFYVMKDSS